MSLTRAKIMVTAAVVGRPGVPDNYPFGTLSVIVLMDLLVNSVSL